VGAPPGGPLKRRKRMCEGIFIKEKVRDGDLVFIEEIFELLYRF